jgi:hypothetical protein
MEKPTEAHLLMLAKMQVCDQGVELDNQMPIALSRSKKVDVLKCGMLNVCLAINKGWLASFNKLTQVCIDFAVECAPMAGLLLGLLIERGGRMLGLHGFASKFIELCEREAEDVRATSVFLLGCSNDVEVAKIVEKMGNDPAVIVREQVVFALGTLMGQQGLLMIERFAGDQEERVRNAYEAVRNGRDDGNPILKNLIASVREKGFQARYHRNVFDIGNGQ